MTGQEAREEIGTGCPFGSGWDPVCRKEVVKWNIAVHAREVVTPRMTGGLS